MKFTNAETYVDRVIEEFVKVGEAVAPRQIQMPKGVIFIQMSPEDPASGVPGRRHLHRGSVRARSAVDDQATSTVAAP